MLHCFRRETLRGRGRSSFMLSFQIVFSRARMILGLRDYSRGSWRLSRCWKLDPGRRSTGSRPCEYVSASCRRQGFRRERLAPVRRRRMDRLRSQIFKHTPLALLDKRPKFSVEHPLGSNRPLPCFRDVHRRSEFIFQARHRWGHDLGQRSIGRQ